jgi:hypothetical protein
MMSDWVTKYDRPIFSEVNSPRLIAARNMLTVTPPSGKNLWIATSSGMAVFITPPNRPQANRHPATLVYAAWRRGILQ